MNLPTEYLAHFGRLYPEAWRQVEVFRAGRGVDLPDWPAWCFLPLAAWYAIVSGGDTPRLEQIADVGKLAAIGTWRYSQGIYRFDKALFEQLRETQLVGDMPSEVLLRLPEWCAYIETPTFSWMDDELYGFWVHLEWDVNTKRHELRLILNTASGLSSHILHIGPWTLTEATDRFVSEAKVQSLKQNLVMPNMADFVELSSAALQPLIALVLYICSDEPEIDDDREPGRSPKRAEPVKTKKGARWFPAEKPRVWNIGSVLGEKLRAAEGLIREDVDIRSVKPHLRRSHWHGFWTGPRDGERKYNYKFLPAIFVAGSAKKVETDL